MFSQIIDARIQNISATVGNVLTNIKDVTESKTIVRMVQMSLVVLVLLVNLRALMDRAWMPLNFAIKNQIVKKKMKCGVLTVIHYFLFKK